MASQLSPAPGKFWAAIRWDIENPRFNIMLVTVVIPHDRSIKIVRTKGEALSPRASGLTRRHAADSEVPNGPLRAEGKPFGEFLLVALGPEIAKTYTFSSFFLRCLVFIQCPFAPVESSSFLVVKVSIGKCRFCSLCDS